METKGLMAKTVVILAGNYFERWTGDRQPEWLLKSRGGKTANYGANERAKVFFPIDDHDAVENLYPYLIPDGMNRSFRAFFTSESLGCPAYDKVFFFIKGQNDTLLWRQLCYELTAKDKCIWSTTDVTDSHGESVEFSAYMLQNISGTDEKILIIILEKQDTMAF